MALSHAFILEVMARYNQIRSDDVMTIAISRVKRRDLVSINSLDLVRSLCSY